ncbi:MAG: hypothetical protein ACRDPS_04735 [Nocardioides sp.]|uniref:hypothetical protein n=1 Tax=Nocardioides sp. TaxID=35761 RepID=UPI003D6BE019
MALPAIAVRTASFILASALVWLAYPVLAVLVYLGLLIASAAGGLDAGGPLAGPMLVILGAGAGVLCVAIAAPAALAARVVGGVKGVLAGSVVLLVLVAGVTLVTLALVDFPGHPVLAGALLLAATTPAALVLALSDAGVGLLARVSVRRTPLPADA